MWGYEKETQSLTLRWTCGFRSYVWLLSIRYEGGGGGRRREEEKGGRRREEEGGGGMRRDEEGGGRREEGGGRREEGGGRREEGGGRREEGGGRREEGGGRREEGGGRRREEGGGRKEEGGVLMLRQETHHYSDAWFVQDSLTNLQHRDNILFNSFSTSSLLSSTLHHPFFYLSKFLYNFFDILKYKN